MSKITRKLKTICIVLAVLFGSISCVNHQSLWDKMKTEKNVLTLSAWFRAQDVDQYLSRTAGLDSAVNWCKKYGVTKVYLEAYGRGLYAKKKTLLNAKARFLKDGFEVSSGVTTEEGQDNFQRAHCFTKLASQEEIQRIFEYTASMFDEIVIDDWYFTTCTCNDCVAARGDQSWSQYYTDLMAKVSRERAMKPAHKVNPNVKVIIKYPQWNDEYHIRGYDVIRESKIFDGIWVGTEARNFDYEKSQGYEIGYNAYFNMRWLATLGNVGGGWFDTGGKRTKVTTYMEQARHTVLGEGKQMIIWCYGEHLAETPKMEALSKELPGLVKLAKIVQGKQIKGVHILKPGNSDPLDESWICSYIGNLAIPFVQASKFNEQAQSAVFTVQALKDSDFVSKFDRLVNTGVPIVISDGLAKRLKGLASSLDKANLTILPVNGSSKTLLKMTREQIKPFRDKLLSPFGLKFDAPNKVELYLFGDNTFVVENINEEMVDVTLELPKVSNLNKTLVLPDDGSAELSQNGKTVKMHISANTLVVVEYK